LISLTPAQATETTGIGVAIGMLGGLFGKGGSAIATPLLRWIGLPGYIAVASPLPAVTPGTLVAASAYGHAGFSDNEVVRWGILVGIPATAFGAWLSRWTGSEPLLILTGVLVLGFGLTFLFAYHPEKEPVPEVGRRPRGWKIRLIGIGVAVGLISGLLANSGGFLLAPLYSRVLKLPLKTAFACSLWVSAVLAIPGTLVHWYLGHIWWAVAGLVAVGSVPLSYLGARLAIHTNARRLERLYGVVLTGLGAFFLLHH